MVLLTVVCLLALGVHAPAQSGGNLIALIEAYYQGRQDKAIEKAAAIVDLGPVRLQFVQQTPVWVTGDQARQEARRATVAAFLLELTAARLESD
jgi:hypothetical protein